jgi:hypothetical protein
MKQSAASDRLRKAMWALEFPERAAMLVASIIEHERYPLATIEGLVELIGTMSGGRVRGIGVAERGRLANRLRDLADRLEHPLGAEENLSV